MMNSVRGRPCLSFPAPVLFGVSYVCGPGHSASYDIHLFSGPQKLIPKIGMGQVYDGKGALTRGHNTLQIGGAEFRCQEMGVISRGRDHGPFFQPRNDAGYFSLLGRGMFSLTSTIRYLAQRAAVDVKSLAAPKVK
jgi:hypothetical protein